jgi:hypothetical protein
LSPIFARSIKRLSTADLLGKCENLIYCLYFCWFVYVCLFVFMT